jgi:hypothetical protein
MAFLTFRPRYEGGLEHSFPHMNAHSTANVIDGMHAFHRSPFSTKNWQVMAFDLDMISIGCVAPMEPVMKFATRFLEIVGSGDGSVGQLTGKTGPLTSLSSYPWGAHYYSRLPPRTNHVATRELVSRTSQWLMFGSIRTLKHTLPNMLFCCTGKQWLLVPGSYSSIRQCGGFKIDRQLVSRVKSSMSCHQILSSWWCSPQMRTPTFISSYQFIVTHGVHFLNVGWNRVGHLFVDVCRQATKVCCLTKK